MKAETQAILDSLDYTIPTLEQTEYTVKIVMSLNASQLIDDKFMAGYLVSMYSRMEPPITTPWSDNMVAEWIIQRWGAMDYVTRSNTLGIPAFFRSPISRNLLEQVCLGRFGKEFSDRLDYLESKTQILYSKLLDLDTVLHFLYELNLKELAQVISVIERVTDETAFELNNITRYRGKLTYSEEKVAIEEVANLELELIPNKEITAMIYSILYHHMKPTSGYRRSYYSGE